MADSFTQVCLIRRRKLRLTNEYYKKTREQQKYLVLQTDDTKDFGKIYKSYFDNICGFFIIESTVWKKTTNLISNAYVWA